MTAAINQPRRIQRRRSKGWRMPANTVYVGRGSKWGNPFICESEPALACAAFEELCAGWRRVPDIYAIYCAGHGGRMGYPQLYKCQHWLSEANKSETGLHLSELRGKNLACWCPLDRPCHADLLLKLANKENSE